MANFNIYKEMLDYYNENEIQKLLDSFKLEYI